MEFVIFLVILLGATLSVVFWGIGTYNRLVASRNSADNAWAQVDVLFRRRFDLIPNLVETVKGYAAHERTTLENVTAARAALQNATVADRRAEAENMLTNALKSLFAVAEAYPDLKANQNFMELQRELSSTESRIAFAKQFYNDVALGYNTLMQQFPESIIAGIYRFAVRDYYPIEQEAREPVRVQF